MSSWPLWPLGESPLALQPLDLAFSLENERAEETQLIMSAITELLGLLPVP